LTGSGNETAAHLIENGRITIMFCSFSEQPMILRLYGQGRVIHPRDQEWQTVSPLFDSLPGKRQIIMINVELVQTSCGYGVPIYEFKEERQKIIDWATQKGEQGLKNIGKRKSEKY
jgi:hypothetical protein